MEVKQMKNESLLNHYAGMKFIKKIQYTQKATKLLIQLEQKKSNDPTYRLTTEELHALLKYYPKIQNENPRCYREFQDRVKALTGKQLKTLRKLANRLQYSHIYTNKKKDGDQ